MKFLFIILLTFLSFNLIYSQDVIVKKDGTSIDVKVEQISVKEIKYYKYDNLDGPSYIINKSEVVIINFENGSFELINSKNEIKETLDLTKEESKELIVELINNHSYVWGHSSDIYIASFDGDLLSLEYNYKKYKENGKKRYYDFSKVNKFDAIVIRNGKNTILNIYVENAIRPDTKKWVGIKLRIGMRGIKNGNNLWEILKYYNRLLLDEKDSLGN
jgi:hypothetical protein